MTLSGETLSDTSPKLGHIASTASVLSTKPVVGGNEVILTRFVSEKSMLAVTHLFCYLLRAYKLFAWLFAPGFF